MSDIQDAVLYKLGRIEASLDDIKISVAATQAQIVLHLNDDEKKHTAFDSRIRSLETTRTKALGFIAAVATISPMLAHWIEKTLHLA